MRGTARGAAAIAEDIISAPERTRALPSRRLARTCGPLRGHTGENTSQNTFGTARTRQVLFCGGARAVAPPGRRVGCCAVGEARAPPSPPARARAPRAARGSCSPSHLWQAPWLVRGQKGLKSRHVRPAAAGAHLLPRGTCQRMALGVRVPFFWFFFSTATCAAVRAVSAPPAAACFRGRSFEGGAQARVG